MGSTFFIINISVKANKPVWTPLQLQIGLKLTIVAFLEAPALFWEVLRLCISSYNLLLYCSPMIFTASRINYRLHLYKSLRYIFINTNSPVKTAVTLTCSNCEPGINRIARCSNCDTKKDTKFSRIISWFVSLSNVNLHLTQILRLLD